MAIEYICHENASRDLNDCILLLLELLELNSKLGIEVKLYMVSECIFMTNMTGIKLRLLVVDFS